MAGDRQRRGLRACAQAEEKGQHKNGRSALAGSSKDLRQASSRDAVSVTLDDLSSPIDQYEKCQRVAQAAYQLQLHGIIAPAA